MLLTDIYTNSPSIKDIEKMLVRGERRIRFGGMAGSLPAVMAASLALVHPQSRQLLIANSKDEALYLNNDIETLLGEMDKEFEDKQSLLFPTTHRRNYDADDDEAVNDNYLMRSEVAKQLSSGRPLIVVSYPEALFERVVSRRSLSKHTFAIAKGASVSIDTLIDILQDYEFDRVDFVVKPGEYAIRGGIVDVFSFSNENPFRIELFDDEVESLRTFDTTTQLSIHEFDTITILPNLERQNHETLIIDQRVPLSDYFDSNDVVWMQNPHYIFDAVHELHDKAMEKRQAKINADHAFAVAPDCPFCDAPELFASLEKATIVEYGNSHYYDSSAVIESSCEPQPNFNKEFKILANTLHRYDEQGYQIIIATTNDQQQRRLVKIFKQIKLDDDALPLTPDLWCKPFTIHHGFIDHNLKILCFTDHEIFDRYHKYVVRDLQKNREALTIKELFELKPGDFVTHIDFGVGRFSGLEKVVVNGKEQEVIRLIYKDNGILYVNIHNLHKISRYVGKEGTAPTLNRLGSTKWKLLKERTKKRVKDIAKDLIALYAKRKASQGFAFSPDSYLQNELEASFIFEDTPDQMKATIDVKRDMEAHAPMDRLVCGDVGFGKTEIAIRAAFKAVCDSKQVAVLVPNTILAFQHFNTFSTRLKGLPVNIDYLNRFRTTKEKTQIFKDIKTGRIDIIIGTHAILSKNIEFKDLGLIIVDEEQKFGVAAKEKLRQFRVDADYLTLTATPIPRTLQFSLMGARDLSVLNTPPPNRLPIQTEVRTFDESVIRDAIEYEMDRGGQTFFVSNRIENLDQMAALVLRLVPDARVTIAHGQMDGKIVEERIIDFLEGNYDVLIATSIIENGLDIPNANTMIVNDAQNFGLSDLHQIRGRVGRSNRKAFCYMLVPSFNVLSPDARKRLNAIEEFDTLGSGLNLAMRDLDIRGAGNILGAEQSGFVADIGYDAFHKILDEAILELKENDFHDLFREEIERSNEYVHECSIDIDIEALLPDDYVSNSTERLVLYKRLSILNSDEELDNFRSQLIDRFGPIPEATKQLISTIVLRRIAKGFAIERIGIHNGTMTCKFVSNPYNPFFQSDIPNRIISLLQRFPSQLKYSNDDGRITLSASNINSVPDAIALLQRI